MAQRWRSRARRDPDLDDDDGSPLSQQPRRGGRGGGGGSDEDDDDELGNEDLSLEIVARAQRKRRGEPGFADLLSVSSVDEEVDGDAVVELGEAEEPRRKQMKKQRRKQRKKQRKEATEAAAAAAAVQGEREVFGEPGGRAPGFAELLSVSSTDEDVDEDAVVELGEVEPRRKQRKKQYLKQRKKQRKEATMAAVAAAAAVEEEKEVCGTQEGPTGTAESVLTEDGADVPASDNRVLRKLLRIPRYFDPGETLLETCFNCSEEGHVAANCPMEKRKKPCFVCGLFGHNAKQCTQGQDCFICKKGGHMAKDCPNKLKRIDHQSTLCLRCGETGHDMFGCTNDYPQDDIKQIRCYVCNHNGHLCCTDFSDNCPKQISCYNCAQSGHSGLGCAKQRRETSVVTTPTLCYSYYALPLILQSDWSKGKSSSHTKRKEKWKKDFSARSAPHDARKSSKRKSPHSEERMETLRHKSKSRGGWTGGDDLEDLSFKKYKSNGGWGSPSTPKKPYTKHHPSSSGGDYTPRSSQRRNHSYTTPDSNYSPSARKHGLSSSRFAVGGTHIRFGRS